MRSISSWMSFGVMWVETVATSATFPAPDPLKPLVVAKLGNPILVEPEVVREFVEDRDPDLLTKLVGVGKALLERNSVDRDLVGQRAGHVAALGERYAVVEAEQVRIVGVFVLDDDREVLERPGQVRRKLVEGGPDVILEAKAPHVITRAIRAFCAGRQCMATLSASASARSAASTR